MGEGPAETMIELGPAYSDTTGIAGNVDMISFVPLIGLRQSPLPKSCADIRSIPMLADDWGVPRCEADERGGVVLACLVEPLGAAFVASSYQVEQSLIPSQTFRLE